MVTTKQNPTFLAIDLGTSSVKAAVFDHRGTILSLAGAEYPMDCPGPNLAVFDPADLWDCTRKSVKECLSSEKIDADSIIALSLTAQAQTFALMDREDAPLTPMVTWLDKRSVAEGEELTERLGADRFYSKSGFRAVTPQLALPKILWFKRNEPAVWGRLGGILLSSSYILWKLSGEKVVERDLAVTTGLYDMESKSWWDETLGICELSPEVLPRPVDSGEEVGRLRPEVARELGLPESLVVVGGAKDQTVNAIGAGNYAPGIISESTGTALVVYTVVDDAEPTPVCRPVRVPFPVAGYFSRLVFAPAGGMALRWARDLFCLGQSYEALFEKIEKIPLGSDGLLSVAHFSGLQFPVHDSRSLGQFLGIGLHHTGEHFCRAVVESICFMIRELIEMILPRTEGLTVRSTGGGARSEHWLQLKADTLGMTVERPRCEETALLGTAILAGVGSGQFASITEAGRNLCHTDQRYDPDAESRERAAALYEAYRQALARSIRAE